MLSPPRTQPCILPINTPILPRARLKQILHLLRELRLQYFEPDNDIREHNLV